MWSFDAQAQLRKDDYFQREPFVEPVGDYVAAAGAGLGAVEAGVTIPNDVPATSWQHTLAEIVLALCSAGLRLEHFVEYPHANGCRVIDALVPGSGRTWVWPDGMARVPLMFGLRAVRA